MRSIEVLRQAVVLCALITVLLSPTTCRSEVINPHLDEHSCQSCHSRVPDPQDIQAGEFFLLGPSIDETCGQCHVAFVDQDGHGSYGHPTGMKITDPRVLPLSLPLNQGFITCKTCHHCIAAERGYTFALLRLADSAHSLDKQRTELCRDCHKGY